MESNHKENVFEKINSRAFCVCMKSDFDKYKNGEIYLYTGYIEYNDKSLKKGEFYTLEQCIDFLKNYKYINIDDKIFDDPKRLDEFLSLHDFTSYEKFFENDFSYEKHFTTTNNDEVVVFGYFGSDF